MLLLTLLLLPLVATPQAAPDSLPATGFHAVSYLEVAAATESRGAAAAAFKSYAAASRTQDGFIRFEAFEQAGRPGHYVFIETWRDQAAFDKRGSAKQLTDALQPIRIADVDRRPYKTMTVAPIAKTSRDTVYVITHVDASPTPQLPMILQRLAEDSRKDDGNLRFDIIQHTMRANHFTIIEAWKSRKALDAHAAAPHTRQYREEFGPMAGSPLDERIFEALADRPPADKLIPH